MQQLSESELLGLIAQDHKAALRELVERQPAWLWLRLRRRTCDEDLADPALHDAFVTVGRSPRSFPWRRGRERVAAQSEELKERDMRDETKEPAVSPRHVVTRMIRCLAFCLALCLTTASCSSVEARHPAAQPSPPSDSRYPSSIVVLGHSGTTGADSDPASPDRDVRANSWATGTNPAVESVYQRIVAMNPNAKGNAENFGVDGSDVKSLIDQEALAAKVRPKPDLVIIQSIDNDIKCDNTDPLNYGPYRRVLTEVLDHLGRDLPDADIFFVDQWTNVKAYDRVVVAIDPAHLTGPGPCDVVDQETQKLVPQRERYMQSLVDHYFAIITDVCAKHPRCRTDNGAMQGLHLEEQDLTQNLDHLAVPGQRKMAALAYQALYG